MLITIPNIPPVKQAALLDLIEKSMKINFIHLKLHSCCYDLEKYITPSIKLVSREIEVHGIKTLTEVRELFLTKEYQILELKVYGDDCNLDIDILHHSITQHSPSLIGRPLTQQILAAEGLIGGNGITSFTDMYDRK
jgi:hypothetical protein